MIMLILLYKQLLHILPGMVLFTAIEESITSLTDNGDGTFTYISEDGTSTTYDETTTGVALNINNTSLIIPMKMG